MNQFELVYQLRWMCDLAAAMGQTEVPLSAVRQLIEREEAALAVRPVSLDEWKKTKRSPSA